MKNDRLIQRIGNFVLSCSDHNISDMAVSSLAKMFNINRSLLSREFMTKNRLNLHRFILIEKLQRAARTLKQYPDISVRELSERLGFFSCDHFTRIFKAHYGICPKKYKDFQKEELKN